MKYFTTLLLIALLCSISNLTYAQDENLDEQDLREWSRGAQVVPTKNTSEVEGTPYYNEEWQKGYILLKSGKKSKPLNLKYNSFTNELLFQRDGELLAVSPIVMQGFVLTKNSQQTTFKKGFKDKEKDISRAQYLRMIYDGNIQLVVKHYVRQNERRDILGGGNQIIKYLPKKDYFLITANGSFHEIKLEQKDILRTLDSHRQELKKFSKSNDLSFKSENDLRTILLEYDNMTDGSK